MVLHSNIVKYYCFVNMPAVRLWSRLGRFVFENALLISNGPPPAPRKPQIPHHKDNVIFKVEFN